MPHGSKNREEETLKDKIKDVLKKLKEEKPTDQTGAINPSKLPPNDIKIPVSSSCSHFNFVECCWPDTTYNHSISVLSPIVNSRLQESVFWATLWGWWGGRWVHISSIYFSIFRDGLARFFEMASRHFWDGLAIPIFYRLSWLPLSNFMKFFSFVM